MAWAAVAGLVAPAASWPISEVAKAACPVAVASPDSLPIAASRSLPPVVTVTTSSPLNLPLDSARWLAICCLTETVVVPSGEPVSALPVPTGSLMREPPWA
jgi:hypothetical protein